MKIFRKYNDGHGIIWHLIDNGFEWSATREKHKVKKKTFLRLMIGGVFGLHRFYAHQYVYGIIYLATCWFGFSLTMTVCDFIIYAFKQPDEEGYLYI